MEKHLRKRTKPFPDRGENQATVRNETLGERNGTKEAEKLQEKKKKINEVSRKAETSELQHMYIRKEDKNKTLASSEADPYNANQYLTAMHTDESTDPN